MLKKLLIVAAIGGLAVAAVFVYALDRGKRRYYAPGSANNLKQMGVVFKMYEKESEKGVWPSLTREAGVWAPDMAALYPQFLPDLSVLVKPGDRQAEKLVKAMEAAAEADPPDYGAMARVAAENYLYLGWAVRTPEEAAVLAAADLEARLGLETLGEQGKEIRRLRYGVERFLITELTGSGTLLTRIHASIPVMIEVPEGKTFHVLYMDGHVEWHRYDVAAEPALVGIVEALRGTGGE